MVGAGEFVGVPATFCHQLRAAVTAHIDEGLHLTRLSSRDQDLDTSSIHGFVGASVSQFRGCRSHQRHALKNTVHLELPTILVGVGNSGDAKDIVCLTLGPGTPMG